RTRRFPNCSGVVRRRTTLPRAGSLRPTGRGWCLRGHSRAGDHGLLDSGPREAKTPVHQHRACRAAARRQCDGVTERRLMGRPGPRGRGRGRRADRPRAAAVSAARPNVVALRRRRRGVHRCGPFAGEGPGVAGAHPGAVEHGRSPAHPARHDGRGRAAAAPAARGRHRPAGRTLGPDAGRRGVPGGRRASSSGRGADGARRQRLDGTGRRECRSAGRSSLVTAPCPRRRRHPRVRGAARHRSRAGRDNQPRARPPGRAVHAALPEAPAAPIPAGAQVDLEGMPPFLTPAEDFYRIDTALSIPRVDRTTWSLRIYGLVENEIEMSLPELLAEDMVETHLTLTCVSNPVGGNLAGNATWLGVPVRMVGPGLYGDVSATTWLTELKVTRFADDLAYWSTRGWSERGPIKLASRIDVPRSGDELQADADGAAALGGTAWAQQRGISGVQVQIGGGDWQDATLGAEVSVDTWTQWSVQVSGLASGRHTATVRALDVTGELQT